MLVVCAVVDSVAVTVAVAVSETVSDAVVDDCSVVLVDSPQKQEKLRV